MEFNTKVAKIMAEEMEGLLPEPQDIREVETGMRGLLRKVEAAGLKQDLEHTDETKSQEEEMDCECQRQRHYLFQREAVILGVFVRVSYKRRYYVCQACGSGVCRLEKRLQVAAGGARSDR